MPSNINFFLFIMQADFPSDDLAESCRSAVFIFKGLFQDQLNVRE